MTLIKRKNGNWRPSLGEDLFDDRFFGLSNFFDPAYGLWGKSGQMPPANISETKTEFNLDLSAPGLTRADFNVEVDDGILTVSCEKKEEKNEEKDNYKRREFSYNSFSRSFQLPDNVLEEKINAKYDNGMLHISIPKREPGQMKSKKSIEVG